MSNVIGIDTSFQAPACWDPCHDQNDYKHKCGDTILPLLAESLWPHGFQCRLFGNISSLRSAMKAGEVAMESSLYVMNWQGLRNTPEGIHWTPPMFRSEHTLYYSTSLQVVKRQGAVQIAQGLLSPFAWPLLLLNLAMRMAFALLLRQKKWIELSQWLLFLDEVLIGIAAFVYGQNAKSNAIKAFKAHPPFENFHELLFLLRSCSLQLQFSHRQSLLFRNVNEAKSGNLRLLAETFKYNPPRFNLSDDRVNDVLLNRPNTLLFTARRDPTQEDISCAMEVEFVRDLLEPIQAAFRLKNPQLLRKSSHLGDLIRVMAATEKQRLRTTLFRFHSDCPKRERIDGYRTLGDTFVKQMGTVGTEIFIPLAAAVFMIEFVTYFVYWKSALIF